MAKTASDRRFLRKTLKESMNKVEEMLDGLADSAERLFLGDDSPLFKDLEGNHKLQLATKIKHEYEILGFTVSIKKAYTNGNFSYLEIRW